MKFLKIPKQLGTTTHVKASIKTSAVSIGALLSVVTLSACQSTPIQSTSYQSPSSSAVAVMNQSAKTTLVKALQKQRSSNYTYQTNIKLSNDDYLGELKAASPQQLSMSENAEYHCDHMHDQAYSRLLIRTELTETDIEDTAYYTDREAIKSAYIECQTEYEAWATEHTDDYDPSYGDDIEYNSDHAFLPHYDASHTAADYKKAKVMKAYLLKPLTISSRGVYKPMLGKISMMPTLAYQTRNHTSIANHYMYIDAADGAVYIWADTFAYIFSYYFDEELGLGMHNKWLKLDLNDGSLPEGFGKEVIKSHFMAQDSIYNNAAAQDYRYLTDDEVQALHSYIPKLTSQTVTLSNNVIEHQVDKAQLKQEAKDYFGLVYDNLAEKYPELVAKDDDTEQETARADLAELGIVKEDTFDIERSDEGDITAINISSEEETHSDENTLETQRTLDSRYFAKLILSGMQSFAQNITPTADDSTNKTRASDNSSALTASSKIDYAVAADDNVMDRWVWRDVYGMDNNQRINWHLRQRKMRSSDNLTPIESLNSLQLEMFTQYSSASLATPMFADLPEGTQSPNAENTIDLAAYSKELMKKYERGEGSERGRIILEVIKEADIMVLPDSLL